MAPEFDPATLEKFTVIRCLHQFDGDPDKEFKRFVVLGSINSCCIFLKTTTKTEFYKNCSQLSYHVLYSAGALSFFEKETAVESGNIIQIPHPKLR